MSFDDARQIADAVLLEGYVLYPYRASAPKNRFRWAFGVLGPSAWSKAGGCEPYWMQSDMLLEPTANTALDLRLRFLQNRRRTVQRKTADGFVSVPELDVDGELHVPWDEGEVRELDFSRLECSDTDGLSVELPFELAGGEETESLLAADGTEVGRLVRRWHRLQGVLRVEVEPMMASDRPVLRLRVRIENTTEVGDLEAPRDAAIPACLIATHLLLEVSGGEFLSMFDPPEWAAELAAENRFVRCYPVLVGARHAPNLMLAAPIILYDHPQMAPESPGDLFDATEIDELLTIRTRMLTDQEKRHARATDPRAARVIDQVDSMPPEILGRLHGAIRDLEEAEMVPRGVLPPSEVSSHGFVQGGRVVLRPGKRRTDAQDLLFAGCQGTIQAVLRDMDDREVLAVTIDDDPAAELHQWYGRFHYYYPDELESVREGTSS